MADAPEMSLEQAGAALRAELNAHRAKLSLFGAVEVALTAKTQLAQIEKQKAAMQAEIDDVLTVKAATEQAVKDVQVALETARQQLTVSQADLKALNALIADTRKAWATEQTSQDLANQSALGDLDRAIAAKQAELKDWQEKVSAYVTSLQRSEQT